MNGHFPSWQLTSGVTVGRRRQASALQKRTRNRFFLPFGIMVSESRTGWDLKNRLPVDFIQR